VQVLRCAVCEHDPKIDGESVSRAKCFADRRAVSVAISGVHQLKQAVVVQ
jgi:hypothetical protein